jgi:AraC-like DNA-binding protein
MKTPLVLEVKPDWRPVGTPLTWVVPCAEPQVIAVGLSPQALNQLRLTLGYHASVVRRLEDATRLASVDQESWLFIAFSPEAHAEAQAKAKLIKTERPMSRVVGIIEHSQRSPVSAAWSAALSGAFDALLGEGELAERDVICAVVRSLRQRDSSDLIIQKVALPATHPLLVLLRKGMVVQIDRLSPSALAGMCVMNERSLRKYCTRHGLPSPAYVVAWIRLLRAAQAMDKSGVAPVDLAPVLGFQSSAALHRTWLRFLGEPLSRVPRGSALETAAVGLRERVLGKSIATAGGLLKVGKQFQGATSTIEG